jgi:phospholipase/carboxylesterase
MNFRKTIIIALAGLLPFWGKAQTLNTDLSLPYVVSQPRVPSAHPPVLILLHGYGSNEMDLIGMKDQLPAGLLILSVRAPLTVGQNSFQWFRSETVNGISEGNKEDLKSSVAKIKAFIVGAVKKYHANAGQVYLSGFSQGAMMSYEVGLTAPQLLRGIAPLSGKIFESLKPQIKRGTALKNLRIFIGHGDADDRVKYSFAEQANSYLKQIGLTPSFHTYKNMKHAISPEELKDLNAWLTANQ